ncbi:unnamed protein product [Didymodactylos carnosus]|uniref:Uncharacterized protein n=1 Tax=Didymodactylos carnosus TaxID=1234261 RepID=A0A8S2HVJ3_9BILA|nr:unnamed protein product [Didymodactylos carnosus]CAF3690194.1 unnamed protein product [Didymodactylos carnosus]
MSASNQQQPLSTDTRGAPKALEVFGIDNTDPTAPLQAAQLIRGSGADPVIWTSTELTRTTSAGNFRLYKDGSGSFGIWVPNSQAFYSDGAPPNICAPDAQSGQTTDGSHRGKVEPVWENRSYSRYSEYRRNDRVFGNSSQNRREFRVAPYDRSVGYGIVTDHNRRQHHFSSQRQHRHYHCRSDESASQSRLTADSHHHPSSSFSKRERELSSTAAPSRHTPPSEHVRPASPTAAMTVRHERQQRKMLLNRKRRERQKRILTAAKMMVIEQKQNQHQQSASSLSDEDDNDNDDVLPVLVAKLIQMDETTDIKDLADDMERLGGN